MNFWTGRQTDRQTERKTAGKTNRQQKKTERKRKNKRGKKKKRDLLELFKCTELCIVDKLDRQTDRPIESQPAKRK